MIPRWMEIALMIPGALAYLVALYCALVWLVCFSLRNEVSDLEARHPVAAAAHQPAPLADRSKINDGMSWGGSPTNTPICK